jgi:hypothetical protein
MSILRASRAKIHDCIVVKVVGSWRTVGESKSKSKSRGTTVVMMEGCCIGLGFFLSSFFFFFYLFSFSFRFDNSDNRQYAPLRRGHRLFLLP